MAARTHLIGLLALIGVVAADGAAAQGMMMTEPREAAPKPSPVEMPAKRSWSLTVQEPAPKRELRLPNQTTGPKRERVVRDICIGCDAR